MTNHQHLLVELDESGHEPDRHIKISYKSLGWILGSILVLALLAAGAFTSYLQMFWKAQTLDHLRADFDRVRGMFRISRKTSSVAKIKSTRWKILPKLSRSLMA